MYKAINNLDPRISLPEVWHVVRIADDKAIFCDLADPDTQEYLAWLDAGNQPEIVDHTALSHIESGAGSNDESQAENA
jgi:hypothetical protein